MTIDNRSCLVKRQKLNFCDLCKCLAAKALCVDYAAAYRQTSATVGILNAGQRLKRNVKRLIDEHRGQKGEKRTIAGLAAALDQKANGISTILKRSDVPHFKLRDLDTIAAYFGVPPAALIKEDGNAIFELTPTEMAVIRHWRALPRDVQMRLIEVLNYFAGVSPAEKQLRKFFGKYRRLSRADQAYLDRTMDSLLRHTAEPSTDTPRVLGQAERPQSPTTPPRL